MFIPDFWAGVFATVIVEVAIIVVAAGISIYRDNKRKGGNK